MSNMYNLITDCVQLGTKEKQARVQALQDNKDVKELFRLMLCPSILYNIKKVPDAPVCVPISCIISHDSDLELALHALRILDCRGTELKNQVASIHNRCSFELSEVLTWILARKNPAKIGKSIVNKVWPGLIRTQRYMGAVPGSEENLDRLPWETGVAVQDKEDAMAVLIDYKDGIPVAMRTRQGNRIDQYFPGFMDKQNKILYLDKPGGLNGMVHHELFVYKGCVHDSHVYESRKVGNGLISKQAKNAVIGGPLDDLLRSVVLDYVDDDNPDTSQMQRYVGLSLFANYVTRVVRQVTCYSIEEARRVTQERIQAGGEGTVCKDPSKPFKNGKPWWNVKCKNEFEVSLICTGWNKHTEDPNLIGSLVMSARDGALVVNVGGGLTDRIRRMNPDWFIGAVIDVKANEIIKAKKKGSVPSLYLPRFDRGDSLDLPVRTDKEHADTLEQIVEEERMSKGL